MRTSGYGSCKRRSCSSSPAPGLRHNVIFGVSRVFVMLTTMSVCDIRRCMRCQTVGGCLGCTLRWVRRARTDRLKPEPIWCSLDATGLDLRQSTAVSSTVGIPDHGMRNAGGTDLFQVTGWRCGLSASAQFIVSTNRESAFTEGVRQLADALCRPTMTARAPSSLAPGTWGRAWLP